MAASSASSSSSSPSGRSFSTPEEAKAASIKAVDEAIAAGNIPKQYRVSPPDPKLQRRKMQLIAKYLPPRESHPLRVDSRVRNESKYLVVVSHVLRQACKDDVIRYLQAEKEWQFAVGGEAEQRAREMRDAMAFTLDLCKREATRQLADVAAPQWQSLADCFEDDPHKRTFEPCRYWRNELDSQLAQQHFYELFQRPNIALADIGNSAAVDAAQQQAELERKNRVAEIVLKEFEQRLQAEQQEQQQRQQQAPPSHSQRKAA